MAEPRVVDAVVIGGGPAGLSAALNLGRARASVLVVDADRPRNAATLRSHGFLTRDGVPPHEIRRLARTELEAYPSVELHVRSTVTLLAPTDDPAARFAVSIRNRSAESIVLARSVIVATGLRETLPDIAGLRGVYGMSVFSCAACDGWELRDTPLALIGESPDLADRARLLARWSTELTVFTHASDAVTPEEEQELATLGVAVDRRRIRELEGDRGSLSAVRLEDGGRVAVSGGLVRPTWQHAFGFADGLEVDRDADGHLVVDRSGRSSLPGLYGAGDAVAPGPQQLIVAAGQGCRAAAVLVQDLIGVVTAH